MSSSALRRSRRLLSAVAVLPFPVNKPTPFPRTIIIMNPKSRNNSTITSMETGSSRSGEAGKSPNPKQTRTRDHLELTSGQQREPGAHSVIVSQIQDISPTVKKVVLTTSVTPVPIHFKAGQWIDMFIPNEKTVGGFSMTSSPLHLQRTGNLELAIKYSTWPPAFWIHTQCKIGSEVRIQTGGDFFFDSSDSDAETDRVLLLAGGVGINPLASMVNQIEEEKREKPVGSDGMQTSLLFSAKIGSELLFKEHFESFAERDKNFKCRFFITGVPAGEEQSFPTTKTKTSSIPKAGRIGSEDIREALERDLNISITHAEDTDKLHVYICGPPPMIQEMEDILKSLNITKNIFYEKWWQ